MTSPFFCAQIPAGESIPMNKEAAMAGDKVMRAKFQVQSVEKLQGGQEVVKAMAVCGSDPFGAQGESEDNTFARYTPEGSLSLRITNPDLVGKIEPGKKYYLDFTEAD